MTKDELQKLRMKRGQSNKKAKDVKRGSLSHRARGKRQQAYKRALCLESQSVPPAAHRSRINSLKLTAARACNFKSGSNLPT